MTSVRPQRLSGIALAFLTALPPHALATPDQALEEIVVTARKVPEPRVDVPLALDVITRDALHGDIVTDLAAVARLAPGLYFESFWGGAGAAPVLRGQAQPNAAGANVGVFVDNVYQAGGTAIDPPTLDIERIEVLRGPQNTLFGHSTFAGAIHYVSRQPTDTFRTGAELTGGTDNLRGASGYVSGPLSQTGMLARFAAGIRDMDGDVPNDAGGQPLGSSRRTALTGTLAGSPADGWKAKLTARWSETRSNSPPVSTVDGTEYNCGAVDPTSGSWSYYCGELPRRRHFQASVGLPDNRNDSGQATLALTWRGPGSVEFASETSYYRSENDIYRDFDATGSGETFGVCQPPRCPLPAGPPVPVLRHVDVNSVSRQRPLTEEWSQEVRLQGRRGERLKWMAGLAGILTREDNWAGFGFERAGLAPNERLTVLLPLTPNLAGPIARANVAIVDDPNRTQVTQTKSVTNHRTIGAFGMMDYEVAPRWRIRGELRSTWERTELDSKVANFAPSFGRAIPAQRFNDVTPRVTLQYHPTVDVLLYASAAKGSHAGGINAVPGLPAEEQRFDPEYNWTYEAAAHLDRAQWQANATLYYIDWRDTQVLGFSTSDVSSTLITRNAAGVRTPGFELAAAAELHPRLQLRAAYSLARPEFVHGSDDPGSSAFCGLKGGNLSSSFCRIGPSRDGNAPPGTYVPYIDGNMLQRAPQHQWLLGANGDLSPSSADWRLRLNADVSHQDSVFDRALNGARYGGRTLVTAHATLDGGHWSVELWGTNLTGEHFIRAVSSRGAAFYPVAPRPLDLLYGEGRRLGITVRVEL